MSDIDSAPQPSNGLAITSLVLGIVSLLIVWIPIIGLIGTLLALVGLVLGVVALQRPGGRGLAIGGIVTSSISVVLTVLGFLALGALIGLGAAANAAG